ncbi:MAG TPA: hypothetical protein VM537_20210, partial [Anaerolineae bacterium]|nr:hypothetical protein [Anaerolineae bacterium]
MADGPGIGAGGAARSVSGTAWALRPWMCEGRANDMASDLAGIDSQITFLYYDDLRQAQECYGQVMGFDLVEDQCWAKIYRVSGNSFVGIVAGEKGFRRPQPYNAVLLTL